MFVGKKEVSIFIYGRIFNEFVILYTYNWALTKRWIGWLAEGGTALDANEANNRDFCRNIGSPSPSNVFLSTWNPSEVHPHTRQQVFNTL